MKWIVVGVGLLGAALAARWLRRSERALSWTTFALALLPFLSGAHEWFAVNPISYETYRGDANGLEFTIVDVVALALWLALPRPRAPAPYRAARWAYLGIATATVLWAPLPVFTLLSAWRLVRGFLVLAVVVRACESPRNADALVRGLATGLVVSALEALWQRYGLHAHQCSAFFPHQNGLGMAVNMVAPIVLAKVLGAPSGRLLVAALPAAMVAMILTLSRGSLAMFGVGAALVFGASLLRGLTVRKLKLAAAATLVALALIGYALGTIVERFETAPRSSVEARARFVDAAVAMLAEHPMGVGLNQYSHVLAHDGYADRFRIDRVDRSGLAHHVYWLTAAETGWLGLVALLVMLAAPLRSAVHALRRGPADDPRGDVVLGVGVGLCVAYAQWLGEWGARTMELTYLYWTVVGLVAALSAQLAPVGARNAARRRR